jgi:cellulase
LFSFLQPLTAHLGPSRLVKCLPPEINQKTTKMKAFTLVALATATAVNAHAIFQKVSVNGVDQGQLKGLRAPTSNYPIQEINHADFACNTNLQLKDSTVIKVPAGAKVGAWWGHVIGGASGPSDPDHPIAPSHKGSSFFSPSLIANTTN